MMSHDPHRRALLAAAARSALLLLVPVAARARDATSAASAELDAQERATLLLVARRLYPHADLDDAPYLAVVDALAAAAADADVRGVIRAGLARLDGQLGGSWRTSDPLAQTQALAALEGDPFFQIARQTTAFALYNNPAVWQAFGYGGDAWSFGGYLNRGLSDIDWLPHPDTAATR